MSLAHFPPNTMEASSSADEKTPLVFGKRNKRRRTAEIVNTGHPQVAFQNGRKRTILPLVCIILAVMLERVTYYGILANLVVFLSTDMSFAFAEHSSNIVLSVFVFTGMAWLMSTVGGFVGDSYSGRYNAIWGSLLIYIFGTVSLSLVTYLVEIQHLLPLHKSHPFSLLLTIGTLVILSIGEGAYKANISAFGAEQLLDDNSRTYRQFFNWYYWSINMGAFVAYVVLAWIQINLYFFIGYIIPFGCVCCACLIFCIPRSQYKMHPVSGNILRKICGVIKEAYQRRKGNSTSSTYPSLEEYLPIQSWLDRAMIKYGGSYLDSDVEEVKTLRKISLIFLAQIPYWTIYFQMNSTFLNQGLHMNVEVHPSKFKIPAAWLTLTDVIFVLLLIPVMDKVIYPWLDRKGYGMSVLMRISVGFIFAVASMGVAGVVESSRRHMIKTNATTVQTINHQPFTAANMSIMYQIPQYALIGVSEVFASVGGLEFAYREAPPSMQSFVMGLFYFVQSIGSLLGAGLYSFSSDVVHWTEEGSTSTGPHLDCYFYLLGGIMFVSWVVFVGLSVRSGMPFFNRRVGLRQDSLGSVVSRGGA